MSTVYKNLINHKGIGPHLASKICAKFGISKKTKLTELQNSELLNQFLTNLKKLTKPFKEFQPLDVNLIQYTKDNIKNQITLNTYRGFRWKYGYPVRGQRTRCNAKTAKKLNKI